MKRYLYGFLTILFLAINFGTNIQAQEEKAAPISIRKAERIEHLKQTGEDASRGEATNDVQTATDYATISAAPSPQNEEPETVAAIEPNEEIYFDDATARSTIGDDENCTENSSAEFSGMRVH